MASSTVFCIHPEFAQIKFVCIYRREEIPGQLEPFGHFFTAASISSHCQSRHIHLAALTEFGSGQSDEPSHGIGRFAQKTHTFNEDFRRWSKHPSTQHGRGVCSKEKIKVGASRLVDERQN